MSDPTSHSSRRDSAGGAIFAWMMRHWREWVRSVVVLVFCLLSFRSAVADWNDVPTGSMKPTILEGDRIFIHKSAYDLRIPFTRTRLARWSSPERGDIVVLDSPLDETRLVKRVIGLPGDRIEIRQQRLLVNGVVATYREAAPPADPMQFPSRRPHATLEEDTGDHVHSVLWPERGGFPDFGPVTVPPGNYFVMGDHRDNSLDSREWGCVDGDRIVGKVLSVVGSLDPGASYRPRWSRFFHRLR